MPSEGEKRRRSKKRVITSRAVRAVFVIMPFTSTPTRNSTDLDEFFATNLKRRIEADRTTKFRYVVRRSDDTFDITDRIISDLYSADVVICDLSGPNSNPNVMYELGVRLSVTDKPVILIREAAPDNRRIFDIQGFYAYEYTATRYRELEEHVLGKLKKFESGAEVFQSPVSRVLSQAPSIMSRLRAERVAGILRIMTEGILDTRIIIDTVIEDFLRDHEYTPASEELFETLSANVQDLRDLPWSNLVIAPRVVPALQTALSEPLLVGLLPKPLEKKAMSLLLRYYTHFFSTESAWHPVTLARLLGYMIETFRVWVVFSSIADSIESTGANGFDEVASTLEMADKRLIEVAAIMRSSYAQNATA